MDSDSESDDHPPEFIIHAIDDLAPPRPPPPPARPPAPQRILPPAPIPRRPPPPSDQVTAVRDVLFICKVVCFAGIVIASSMTIYFTVHPIPGESIADERIGVRLSCGLMLFSAVVWLFLSYFSCDDFGEEYLEM
ncbi:hypothetical protein E2562_022303 [Oryza meyeriana var. granulata]|uniref:Uncharacterized protein n=1 Tax=Oryza meyeriana var. granulata TaxID=110450 RepID=A0A6G1D810_9ORYZ|nr:hypothetical protein E2562_022303 [Oryza meyeriana var. granulata]